MSNETAKPLAGAMRIVQNMNHCPLERCPFCADDARIFARESGLAEFVEAVEQARVTDPGKNSRAVLIDRSHWQRIVAAARRVREG